MAWNGSSNRREDARRDNGGASPSRVRGAIAALAVVVIAALAFLAVRHFLSGDGDEAQSPRDRTKTTKIADAMPRVSAGGLTNAAPAEPSGPKAYKDLSNAEKLEYYRKKYGDNIPDNLKPVVYYLENPPARNFRAKPGKASIFKHRSEREIASFLMVEPGTRMVRPVEFGERFDRDLAMSLSDPIEIAADDTEEQRRLKEAVIDAKAELLERAKAGENPSKVMTEAAKELYLLGRYRDDLEAEIRAIKNDPSKSDDDLSLAVEAANKMLAKKGLKPLRQPNMLIRHANLNRARKTKEGGR